MDRKFLRPGWIVGHLLVVLAVLVCLRLGRWQWDRMHEGGTVQNLGYAVLWPVFGAAFVYMWFRFLQLEKLKDAEDDAELTALAAGVLPGTGDHQHAPGTVAESSSSGPQTDLSPAAPRADDESAQPGLPSGDVGSADTAAHSRTGRSPEPLPDGGDLGRKPTAPARGSRTVPSKGITVAVATVGNDDDDPELAAYNRALAALAEKDQRRAR